MTPKNTQHRAAASTPRTTAKKRTSRSASSSRSATSSTPAKKRGASARTASARTAAPSRPSAGATARAPRTRPASKGARASVARGIARITGPVSSAAWGATGTKRESSVRWRWWLLPVVAIAAGTVAFLIYYPVMKVQYRQYRERQALATELKMLQTRNARLRTQVTALQNPEGIEDYARSRLGMVKPGEHVVVVLDNGKPLSSAPTTNPAAIGPQIDSDEVVVNAGPWAAFLDYIFGIR
jgi:cell division protein FtsL